MARVLVHLASGIGNVVLATPLLVALDALGLEVEVLVDGDYAQTAALLEGWGICVRVYADAGEAPPMHTYETVIPAIPPFYWSRYERRYRGVRNALPRPRATLFYRDEQAYYLSFACALGFDLARRPHYRLPIAPSFAFGVGPNTVVLAPGGKTGEMAAKRWRHYPALATRLAEVTVVGTRDDLCAFDGTPLVFPAHVRSLVDRLSLRETAAVLASAGAVVGNDTGLAHVAAAVGTATIMIFGPTPDVALGPLPPNVTVLRAGLRCEPCWFSARFDACAGRVDCLRQVSVDRVAEELGRVLPAVTGAALAGGPARAIGV